MVMVFGEKTITARSPSAARLWVRRGRDGDDSGRCSCGGTRSCRGKMRLWRPDPNFWMGADRRLVCGMCTRLQPLLERLEELKVHVGR
jgi:hypothetical protein